MCVEIFCACVGERMCECVGVCVCVGLRLAILLAAWEPVLPKQWTVPLCPTTMKSVSIRLQSRFIGPCTILNGESDLDERLRMGQQRPAGKMELKGWRMEKGCKGLGENEEEMTKERVRGKDHKHRMNG